MSVTHPSAPEPFSEHTDILSGMAYGFRENAKLWTSAKLTNPNKTQLLTWRMANNFVLDSVKSEMTLPLLLQA